MESVWKQSEGKPELDILKEDAETDVLIVGGVHVGLPLPRFTFYGRRRSYR